jgi:hypothetical protein
LAAAHGLERLDRRLPSGRANTEWWTTGRTGSRRATGAIADLLESPRDTVNSRDGLAAALEERLKR